MPTPSGLPRSHAFRNAEMTWGESTTAMQRALCELAGLQADSLTEDSDLIEMGFDSLLIMRIASLMRRSGAQVEYRDLMESPTPAAWAALIRQRRSSPDAAAESDSVDGTEPFPLATMQHAFWVGRSPGQELGGVSAHFYTEFDREEGVDLSRLEQALQSVIARHGMLRVAISPDGLQRISERGQWPGLLVHNLRTLTGADLECRLSQIRKDESQRIMDIASGEVFDVQVSLFPDNSTRVHFNIDMVAADALSLRNILSDLVTFYEQGSDALPHIEYNYARYLADRRKARNEARNQAREWWRGQLSSLPAAPELPLRKHDDPATGPTVARRHHWLDPAQTSLLRERSRHSGLTVASALATVFAEALGRWSANDRFLLNLPVFDREPLHDDVDLLVGDFSSSVLLDVDLAPRLPFVERARRLQERLQTVSGYAAYPGVEVLRDLSRAGDGHRVLAPVVYTSALNLGELHDDSVRRCLGTPTWIISQGPQVVLDAQVTEFDGGILLNWDTRESLFRPGTLDAMFDAYVGLVERLLTDERAWEEDLSGYALPDRQSGEEDADPVSRVSADPEHGRPLHERFFALAETEPDRVALLVGADRTISYGELSLAARRMAALLIHRGIGRGDSVAITLPKGADQIVAVLGVLAAGAAYVPSGVDVPPARRTKVYETADVRAVITESNVDVPQRLGDTAAVEPADARGYEPIDGPVPVDAEDVMYVIFTSGSTGEPKGVEVPHRAVANTIDAVNGHFAIDGSDRTIALSALDFDLSVYDMFAFLGYGGSVVAVPEEHRRDAAAWAELIRRWRVTVVSAVPALLDMLLVAGDESGLGESLRVVMLGGDRVTVDLPSRLRRLVPGCRFAGLGGMTEAAIHATLCEVESAHGIDPEWDTVPYGRPLRNMRCRVVDSRGLDCPDWAPGELWVSGAGLAHGYRSDPVRTAEKFVVHDGRRWYRTGDLVRYRPDGVLEFLGRTDHQVKIRGHRIELGEVESVLAAHPRVDAAVATVVKRATRQLVAAIVVKEDASEDGSLIDEVKAWIGERLPGYMVPVKLVRLGKLPITRNGKVDRAAVESAFTTDSGSRGEDPVETPSGPVESTVAKAWREILGVQTVKRTDDFFAAGGDSLLATRLIRRLRRAGLADADVAKLFSKPVFGDFAATLSPGEVAPTIVIHPDASHRNDRFDLTDVQRAFWIGRSDAMPLGGVGSHFYLELDGVGTDLDRLEDAWNALVARHEMLRAVVTPDGGARILPEVPAYRIERTEAGRRPEATLHRLREKLSHNAFDPARWPLFSIRAAVYSDGGTLRTRLFVGLDSIIADGRSIMLLFTEWDRLYRDPDAELPAIEVSFRDYAIQAAPDPQRVAAAQEYWTERVRHLPRGPRLPLVRDPSGLTRPRFQRLHHEVDPEPWRRIVDRARVHGLTPSTVLLTCYMRLLAAWSRQDALTVNITLFDRRETEPSVDCVVGDFASLLLLGHEFDPSGAEGFADDAQRLQRQHGRDMANREVSGIWILRELARHTGSSIAHMPVVFTSVLGIADESASLEFSEDFPQQVYGVTQTPQIWLDNKVGRNGEGIAVDWDIVADLFPPDLPDAMFEGYVRLVEGLADADWSKPLPDPLTAEDRALLDGLQHQTVPVEADGQAAAEDAADTAARQRVERIVAGRWQELLGVAEVKRTDDFFDLGGDSIVATRLMSALRSDGLSGAQLAHLFTHPQLRDFAATIVASPSLPATTPLAADPANRYEPFPLTDIQTAYWLGRSKHFDLGGIGAQLYVEYDWHDPDIGRLQNAWNQVVIRHPMLRAVIEEDGMQRVLADTPEYEIRVVEVEALEQAMTPIREEMYRCTRDPALWPLFDLRIVRDSHGRARICLTFDNLIADGLSTLIVIAEWFQLIDDPESPLQPIGMDFRDYVLHTASSEQGLESSLSYWRERLAELPEGPRLPLRIAPREVRQPGFRRRETLIDSGTWRRIADRGREHGLTPSMLLLGCYTSVLASWSAQKDLTVTLTQFDRKPLHPDVNRVVGDFTSLLLVADRPEPGESWLLRARRLQEQLWRDLDHQQVSAVRVLRELAKENARLTEPIPVVFTSMLGVDDELTRSVPWPDRTLSQTPQVWLDHQAIELPAGILLSWDSVDELFPDGLVDDMFAAYRERLLWLADGDWNRPLPSRLPASQRKIRDRVNDTAGPQPRDTRWRGSLHGAFFAEANAAPDRTALIDGDRTVTYGELSLRSRRIAAMLIENGVRPGEAVAVTAHRGAAQVAALFGILAAGAAYVPVSPSQPPRRREEILRVARPPAVLSDDVSSAVGDFPSTRLLIGDADGCQPVPADRLPSRLPDDLAYIVFTSGSTGTPKGVEITHGGAVNTLDDICTRYGIGPDDRILSIASTDFDLSVFDIFGVLGTGGSAVLIGERDSRDPQRWLQLIRRHRVTLWNSVPTMLDMLLTVAEGDLGPSLRLVLVSGDWVGLDLPGRLTACSKAHMVALGGATEASIWSNAFDVADVDPEWVSIPYGFPLRNQRYRVVDETGADRPDWAVGELWIGGDGVARGYRGEPELTADRFVERDGRRWYRTGDLGRYWPDGTLEFLGRADRQVKIHGHRIELGEIEAALDCHPKVRRSVCMSIGERADAQLVAFVVPDAAVEWDARTSPPALAGELAGHLAERLPTAWLPRLLPLADLPLTANGKIDFAALEAHARRQAPSTEETKGGEPLRPGAEEEIGRIWADVLGRPPASRDSNFFGMGGDSLSATRLIQRIEHRLGCSISLREFFAAPTVERLTRITNHDVDLEEGIL